MEVAQLDFLLQKPAVPNKTLTVILHLFYRPRNASCTSPLMWWRTSGSPPP